MVICVSYTVFPNQEGNWNVCCRCFFLCLPPSVECREAVQLFVPSLYHVESQILIEEIRKKSAMVLHS